MASAFLLTFTRSGEVQCLLDDDRRSPQKDSLLVGQFGGVLNHS
jgi:hypothetical protein